MPRERTEHSWRVESVGWRYRKAPRQIHLYPAPKNTRLTPMRNRLPSGCRLRWPVGDCVMDMALGQNTRAVGMAKPHSGFVLQGLGDGGQERIVSILCYHFLDTGWTLLLCAFEDRDTNPYF